MPSSDDNTSLSEMNIKHFQTLFWLRLSNDKAIDTCDEWPARDEAGHWTQFEQHAINYFLAGLHRSLSARYRRWIMRQIEPVEWNAIEHCESAFTSKRRGDPGCIFWKTVTPHAHELDRAASSGFYRTVEYRIPFIDARPCVGRNVITATAVRSSHRDLHFWIRPAAEDFVTSRAIDDDVLWLGNYWLLGRGHRRPPSKPLARHDRDQSLPCVRRNEIAIRPYI